MCTGVCTGGADMHTWVVSVVNQLHFCMGGGGGGGGGEEKSSPPSHVLMCHKVNQSGF